MAPHKLKRIARELAIAVVRVDRTAKREVHFRTDHTKCDDNAYLSFSDIGQRWKRHTTKTFDGYRGQDAECPGCQRRFRIYAPRHLMVEARLR